MVYRGTVEASREPYPNAYNSVNQMPIVRDHFPEGGKPSDLKRDPFLFVLCLECVPDSILEKAENREDTWAFLLSGRKLPQQCRSFFEVGASVQRAWEKIAQMVYGGAVLNRSLLDEALKARNENDTSTEHKVSAKLIRVLFTHGLWKRSPTTFKDAEEQSRFNRMIEKEEQTIRKRSGRKWQPTPLPTESGFEQDHQEELIMAHSWLRWGGYPGLGEPGLCFYSDEALADMLVLLLGQISRYGFGTRAVYYKKMRQRLGLIHWDFRKPIVTKVRRVAGSELIEITCPTRDGEKTHRLSGDNVCFLGGKQLYPLRP